MDEQRRADAVAVAPGVGRRVDVDVLEVLRQRRRTEAEALARRGRRIVREVEVRRPRHRAVAIIERVAVGVGGVAFLRFARGAGLRGAVTVAGIGRGVGAAAAGVGGGVGRAVRRRVGSGRLLAVVRAADDQHRKQEEGPTGLKAHVVLRFNRPGRSPEGQVGQPVRLMHRRPFWRAASTLAQ